MPESAPALVLNNMSKVYRLFRSRRSGHSTSLACRVYGSGTSQNIMRAALEDVSLVVGRGERIGVIGQTAPARRLY